MKYHIITVLLLTVLFACAQSQTEEGWLARNTIELSKADGFDFSKIAEAIGDKRIIAIGESTHGLAGFYTLKSALVQYLHQEHGYEILAMEAGTGDVNLAWTNIDSLREMELMKNTIFGNFQCDEITPLFEHLKEESNSERPLIYAGFDSQMSSSYFMTHLKNILVAHNKTFADTLSEGYSYYYKMAEAGKNLDSLNYLELQNIFLEVIAEANRIVKTNEKAIAKDFNLKPLQLKFIYRTLGSFAQSVDLSYENRYGGSELRDRIMAANLEWLIEEVYPNKKVIIWAHNAHLEKASLSEANLRWMGHILKEKYKDDYYSMGLFAYKGKAYRFWDREIVPFEQTDSLYIANIMSSTGKKTSFLDLTNQKENEFNAWMFNEVNAFEMENGGHVTFVPVERFDGLLTIYESDAPTFK